MAQGNDPFEGVEGLLKIFKQFANQIPGLLPDETKPKAAEPTAEKLRDDLLIGLAQRAVEALEDIALNLAAVRQRITKEDG